MNSACNSIEVPIFTPNKNEFKNFREFIGKIENDPKVIKAGLAKVNGFCFIFTLIFFSKTRIYLPNLFNIINVIRKKDVKKDV